MTFRCRWLAVLVGVALFAAGCGGQNAPEPDRLSLRTPKPTEPRVTDAERRVVRGWAEALNHGRVAAAAKFFSVPSEIVNLPPGKALRSARDIESFNDSFPCGAKLIGAVERATGRLVLGDFELTDRPGGQCDSVGARMTFAFLIDADDHIARFILVEDRSAPDLGTDLIST